MLDRDACQRRVYRLATLLTGNPVAATGVIQQVIDAQPDLRQLDSAHMDRVTVLRSREIAPAILVIDSLSQIDGAVGTALAALTAQQREAWVFARVYHTPLREIARAMDCSVTATQRHLELADSAMLARLGNPALEQAPRILLAYSMALDVPEFYRAKQRRRRLLRNSVKIAIAILVIAMVVAGYIGWRQFEQNRQGATTPSTAPATPQRSTTQP